MIVLGLDPDTKSTGLGLVSANRPLHARLIEVPNRRAKVQTRISQMIDLIDKALLDTRVNHPDGPDIQCIVVEGQRHRTGSPVRAQDLIHLAQVTGAIAGICRTLWPIAPILIPEPADWKGSIPKAAFTKRILRNLRLGYGDKDGLQFDGSKVRLPGTVGLAKRDATHVIDGLGLAYWGWQSTTD